MPILNIQTSSTGLVGVVPSVAYISTNDTLVQITATGYLNQAVQNGASLTEASMCLVSTKISPSDVAVEVGWLEVSHVGNNWSLVPTGAPGTVVLPTIANHIATYTNTTGTLSEDAPTAINAGNIQAGVSGTAAYLASFPATAAKGSLRLAATNSAGDTVTQITNASQAAARVYSIPDGGQSASSFLLTDSSGTQTIATGSLALTLGNITAAAGNIAATLGSLAAGTTVTAGTGVTATTGNIVASAGNVSGFNIIPGFASTVSSSGTLTLTAASKQTQEITGLSVHTVVLPVVSTLAAGTPFTIINNATGSVTVQSSGLNTIQVMAPGTQVDLISVLTSGTTAASWQSSYISDTGLTGAVLLAPAGTQTITNGNLIISTGGFISGTVSGGTVGSLVLYSNTASKGSIEIDAADNAVNAAIVVTNASFGQASTLTIPDPGAGAANFILSRITGTQHITVGAFQVDAGIISSGISTGGTAGGLVTYPAIGSRGSFAFTPVGNLGNFASVVSPLSTLGQASTYTLPDPANAAAVILVGATATPFTTGRLLSSSGTGGLVADSGIATSNVQLITQVKAVLTGNIGGAGAGPLTVTVAGMTAASVVVATVSSSSNPCYVLTAVPGSGSFALTVSADPGASLIVNYIAYIAAQ